MDETTYTPSEASTLNDYYPNMGSLVEASERELTLEKRAAAFKKLGGLKELSASERKATKNVREMLASIGEDPFREGLLDTPKRVVKSWRELYRGYSEDPKEILSTVFEDGTCEEMVLLRDVQFNSMCEHHMLPFIGTAHVAYIPNGKVVGLSKLARLVDCFSRRLQIQEKMTMQIAQALQDYLEPLGSAVIVKAHHQCMSCRGVRKTGTTMLTSSMLGVFKTDPDRRREFIAMLGNDI
jgi:GTP cyclohydrolase I